MIATVYRSTTISHCKYGLLKRERKKKVCMGNGDRAIRFQQDMVLNGIYVGRLNQSGDDYGADLEWTRCVCVYE